MITRAMSWCGLAGAVLLVGSLVAPPARAASTTVHAVFDGSEPEMPQRLLRDGEESTCEMANFPGIVAGPSFYRTFPFCNPGPDTCFTAVFDAGTCDIDVHLQAYINRFDPTDLTANYVGDLGATETQPFSFVVPAGAVLLIVAQTNFGMADCAFGFTVDAMPCAAPAPALSGSAATLAVGGLLLVAATVLRRTRRGLSALVLAATLGAFTGPAAAPLAAAGPTPVSARACELGCSAQHKACARERCDSGRVDRDPTCLDGCRAAYQACRQACR